MPYFWAPIKITTKRHYVTNMVGTTDDATDTKNQKQKKNFQKHSRPPSRFPLIIYLNLTYPLIKLLFFIAFRRHGIRLESGSRGPPPSPEPCMRRPFFSLFNGVVLFFGRFLNVTQHSKDEAATTTASKKKFNGESVSATFCAIRPYRSYLISTS